MQRRHPGYVAGRPARSAAPRPAELARRGCRVHVVERSAAEPAWRARAV